MGASSGVWLFGYGSLVSRASFSHTLGRELSLGDDFHEAEIAGYGRRWEYSIRTVSGDAVRMPGERSEPDEWTVVVLGLADAPDETVNGVVGWVADDELAEFDRREGTYERVDVTECAVVHDSRWRGGHIITYVPTDEPRRRYRDACVRDTAVVDEHYWRLVDDAFAGLGDDRRERYHATTPTPAVPIVPIDPAHIPATHRVDDAD